MTHPLLLLIDIQQDYFAGGRMALDQPEAAAAQARRLLDVYRQRHWPRLFVQHEAARPGATFFLPGTPGVEFHPLCAPLAGETVITKHYPNSFRETDLADHVTRLGASELLICGMMTHMCVDATVRAAVDGGLSVRVAADACATRELDWGGRRVAAAEVQTAFLAALERTYAHVACVDELLGVMG